MTIAEASVEAETTASVDAAPAGISRHSIATPGGRPVNLKETGPVSPPRRTCTFIRWATPCRMFTSAGKSSSGRARSGSGGIRIARDSSAAGDGESEDTAETTGVSPGGDLDSGAGSSIGSSTGSRIKSSTCSAGKTRRLT